MLEYIFYFVSLSDGDSSLRIRYISAFKGQNSNVSIDNTQKITAPFSSLYFIMNGTGTYNKVKVGKGFCFLITSNTSNSFTSDDPECLIMQIAFSRRIYVK